MPTVLRPLIPLTTLFGGPVCSDPSLPSRLWRCYDRYLQRRHLAELDEHLLGDIGITREEAAKECRKPFWL